MLKWLLPNKITYKELVGADYKTNFLKYNGLLKRKRLTGAELFKCELRAGPLIKFSTNLAPLKARPIN